MLECSLWPGNRRQTDFCPSTVLGDCQSVSTRSALVLSKSSEQFVALCLVLFCTQVQPTRKMINEEEDDAKGHKHNSELSESNPLEEENKQIVDFMELEWLEVNSSTLRFPVFIPTSSSVESFPLSSNSIVNWTSNEIVTALNLTFSRLDGVSLAR